MPDRENGALFVKVQDSAIKSGIFIQFTSDRLCTCTLINKYLLDY